MDMGKFNKKDVEKQNRIDKNAWGAYNETTKTI